MLRRLSFICWRSAIDLFGSPLLSLSLEMISVAI